MSDFTVRDLIEQGFANLRREMESGFRSTHARIGEVRDTVKEQNGRIGRAEIAIAVLRGDIDRAEDDVKAFGHRRSEDPPAAAVLHERASDRDKTLIETLIEKTAVRYLGALAAGGAGLKFIEWFVKEVVK